MPEFNPANRSGAATNQETHRDHASPVGWSLTAKVVLVCAAALLMILLAVVLIPGTDARTQRLPQSQATFAHAAQGIFHDLIPLRAVVVPRETIYIDAIDGGRVDRVLVEPGDIVQQGQPIIELSNTNLVLSVIQQESQLNQAISQLQQNEIALEQNRLSNERAIAEINYNLVRLGRAAKRREGLATQSVSAELRDEVADQLAYFKQLKPIQSESTVRQSALRERLLPDIHRQLDNLRENLRIVHGKLGGLIIRGPATGRVTAIDLKVGQYRNPGERLAEITPDTGMKLSAEIDELYLARVHPGQTGSIDLDGEPMKITVRRVSPQVRNSQFTIDLEFEGTSPQGLVPGAAAQGHLQLGGDTPACILPVGPFLEQSGGKWIFVVAKDGKSAERRPIKVGRRTTEQLEVLRGLAIGERVITSDYTSLEKADRVILTD